MKRDCLLDSVQKILADDPERQTVRDMGYNGTHDDYALRPRSVGRG